MAHPVPDSLTRSPEGRRILFTTALVLVLAGASWGLAHASLGVWSAPVAMLVAGAKALLVAWVFMHLSHGSTTARFAIAIALGFIALLVAGVASDVLLR